MEHFCKLWIVTALVTAVVLAVRWVTLSSFPAPVRFSNASATQSMGLTLRAGSPLQCSVSACWLHHQCRRNPALAARHSRLPPRVFLAATIESVSALRVSTESPAPSQGSSPGHIGEILSSARRGKSGAVLTFRSMVAGVHATATHVVYGRE